MNSILPTNHIEEMRTFIGTLPPDTPGLTAAIAELDDNQPTVDALEDDSEAFFFAGLAVRSAAHIVLLKARIDELEARQ